MAMEHLGRPVPNAVLLGAFAALTQVISLHSVTDAITEKFKPKIAASNCAAATAAYEYVLAMVPTHA
jgi:pyruvate ferredoxin oxidoreductase gamma subunit